MSTHFLGRAAPYAFVLMGAVYLYVIADAFEYTPVPGRIGPDLWPKMILILLGAVCLFELGRITVTTLVAGRGDAHTAPLRTSLAPAGEEEEEEHFPLRVLAAIAATVVYLIAYETVGFFIDTVVLLSVLMWIGRFQKPIAAVSIALIATPLFMLMFMRAVFVSLPIGIEPFTRVSLAVMRALGIQ